MARGKQTPPEMIYKIMISYAVTNNISETARQLDMPISTVSDVVDANKDKEEFVKIRREKQDEFITKADRIIDKALSRLEKEIVDADSIPVNNLSTVIGTLYDKRALAKGDSTSNVTIRKLEDLL